MKRVACLFALTVSLICASLFLAPQTSAITYGFVDSNNTFRNTGAARAHSSRRTSF
jgi:hypothetical protein